MNGQNFRQLRERQDELGRFLDRLDAHPHFRIDALSTRGLKKFPYRVSSILLTLDGESENNRLSVPTRYLSRERLGFLTDRFIYPGTKCSVRLVSEFNHEQAVKGIVASSKLISGTIGIHATEMIFLTPIDVCMFRVEATELTALVVEDDELQKSLMGSLLTELGIESTAVNSGEEAIELTKTRQFDLILMDIEMPDKDGVVTTTEIRAAGYMRPIFAITAMGDEETKRRCVEAGCTDYIEKPMRLEDLKRLTRSLIREPLISSLLNEPTMVPLIDKFVQSLTDQLRGLEDAFRAHDFKALETLVRKIKGKGAGVGFDVISETAANVERTLKETQEITEIRRALNDLFYCCIAARPASCDLKQPELK